MWRNSFWSLAHKNETSTFNLSHTDTLLSSNISICNYIFMHSVDRISGGGPILSRKYLGLGITAQKAAFQPPDDWRLPGAPGLLRCLYLHQSPCRYRVDMFYDTSADVGHISVLCCGQTGDVTADRVNEVNLIPGPIPPPATTRAANVASRRFHNHREGPY